MVSVRDRDVDDLAGWAVGGVGAGVAGIHEIARGATRRRGGDGHAECTRILACEGHVHHKGVKVDVLIQVGGEVDQGDRDDVVGVLVEGRDGKDEGSPGHRGVAGNGLGGGGDVSGGKGLSVHLLAVQVDDVTRAGLVVEEEGGLVRKGVRCEGVPEELDVGGRGHIRGVDVVAPSGVLEGGGVPLGRNGAVNVLPRAVARDLGLQVHLEGVPVHVVEEGDGEGVVLTSVVGLNGQRREIRPAAGIGVLHDEGDLLCREAERGLEVDVVCEGAGGEQERVVAGVDLEGLLGGVRLQHLGDTDDLELWIGTGRADKGEGAVVGESIGVVGGADGVDEGAGVEDIAADDATLGVHGQTVVVVHGGAQGVVVVAAVERGHGSEGGAFSHVEARDGIVDADGEDLRVAGVELEGAEGDLAGGGGIS